ncbi:SMP-30/gluconolactonase/LRE family protein [Colwellia sp. E2M01]|uniref:SMP-30/gluconolactonase/LRE family protein n=1 Tax=Colwellia sp. E2M01 TaxID=2841561 RepID=UPI001C0A11AB|nr:SMP-30/gluconolactonase/LRE family protein [Colwellia sp. E2M01]MBU2872089.1 SMP-30/gluconolactonase/LRE family protein [Colwellia sp. E2M01]
MKNNISPVLIPVLASLLLPTGAFADSISVNSVANSNSTNILVNNTLVNNTVNKSAIAQWPQQQGIFTIYSEKALQLLNTKAKLKTLASGFEWVEGPVWVKDGDYLLFSDIPTNKVYRYDDKNGLQTYLSNSGFSNGLKINQDNELLLIQSRSRKVAKMNTSLMKPSADYTVLASHYQGKKLNSPNDSTLHANGSVFFTDPPYGLPKQLDDPAKELDFQGVYRLSTAGDLTLIDKTLTFPNGIALSPDNKWLYVAVSDEENPAWYRYKLDTQGDVLSKELFYKPSKIEEGGEAEIGAPDGLKVHSSGWIFATGPGGVWVFDADKTLLAKINMPGFTANIAFDKAEKTIYLTAHKELRSLTLK